MSDFTPHPSRPSSVPPSPQGNVINLRAKKKVAQNSDVKIVQKAN